MTNAKIPEVTAIHIPEPNAICSEAVAIKAVNRINETPGNQADVAKDSNPMPYHNPDFNHKGSHAVAANLSLGIVDTVVIKRFLPPSTANRVAILVCGSPGNPDSSPTSNLMSSP